MVGGIINRSIDLPQNTQKHIMNKTTIWNQRKDEQNMHLWTFVLVLETRKVNLRTLNLPVLFEMHESYDRDCSYACSHFGFFSTNVGQRRLLSLASLIRCSTIFLSLHDRYVVVPADKALYLHCLVV